MQQERESKLCEFARDCPTIKTIQQGVIKLNGKVYYLKNYTPDCTNFANCPTRRTLIVYGQLLEKKE